MAGRGNPSFLKNQKAQKRVARANAKRAARLARNAEKAARRAAGENPDEQIPASDDIASVDEAAAAEGAPPVAEDP